MKDDYILIVDDELPIREMIHTSLDMAGFQCLQAEDAKQAHQIIVDQRPALILLDWMLPGGVSGVDLCRRLKRDENLAEIPVIMLTARGEEDHKVQGLDAGADDYISKPFSTKELLARIRAVLRRRAPEPETTLLELGSLSLDTGTYRVQFADQPLKLGPTEFKLLHYLMKNAERVHSRAQLLDRVWGDHVFIEERTVDVHIKRLRESMGEAGGMIETVRGAGYRITTLKSQSTIDKQPGKQIDKQIGKQ